VTENYYYFRLEVLSVFKYLIIHNLSGQLAKMLEKIAKKFSRERSFGHFVIFLYLNQKLQINTKHY
jgi:hypothetical protein